MSYEKRSPMTRGKKERGDKHKQGAQKEKPFDAVKKRKQNRGGFGR